MTISDKLSRIFLGLIILIFVFVKIPLLPHPAFWDEVNSYFRGALWLYDNGYHLAISGLHPKEVFYGHTPGYPLALAFLYGLTESIAILRLSSLLLSAWQIYLVFQIAEFLQKGAGLWAALFLVLLSTFYSHSTMLMGDLAVATFGLAAMERAMKNDLKSFTLWSSLAVLSKETSLAILAPLTAYLLWKNGKSGWKNICLILIPSLLLGLHFFLGLILRDNFFEFPRMHTIDISLAGIWNRSLEYGAQQFYHFQDHSLWSLPALLGASLLMVMGNRTERIWVCISGAAILFYLFGVAILTEYSYRYFLPSFALLAVFAGILFGKGGKLLFLPGLILIWQMGFVFNFYSFGNHRLVGNGFEESMQYMQVVQAHQEAIGWLEKNRKQSETVHAIWPIHEYLSDTRYGYVKEVIPVNYSLKGNETWAVVAENSHTEDAKNQMAIVQSPEWQEMKVVNISEKRVTIWKKASASGNTKKIL